MLFVYDIFNINLCEIMNKNQFVCPKIHNYSLFISYLASILKFYTIYRGYSNFLLNMAFISPSEVENIYIS